MKGGGTRGTLLILNSRNVFSFFNIGCSTWTWTEALDEVNNVRVNTKLTPASLNQLKRKFRKLGIKGPRQKRKTDQSTRPPIPNLPKTKGTGHNEDVTLTEDIGYEKVYVDTHDCHH